jgi:hypothetical protein
MRILDHIKAWITWATATDASDRFRKMEVEAGSLDLLVAPFGRHQSNEQCAPRAARRRHLATEGEAKMTQASL